MGLLVTITDAITADLVANVAGLNQATAHKYVPREPVRFERDGHAHIAVWPEAERPMVANPLTTITATGGGDQMTVSMVITYWEPLDSQEDGQSPEKELEGAAYLDLAEATIDRLYDQSLQATANSYRLRFDRLHLDAGDGLRWFALAFTVDLVKDYVP